MKKIVYSILAVVAVFATSSCESRLDIPQKGVSAYETFYQTEEDAEGALVAAYASFATYVTGRGNAFIYTPIKAALNNCGDDMYAAGSNFGDNDFMAALDEFRFDSGNEVIYNLYQGLFLANYTCNLVIDNFKDGLPDGSQTAVTKRCVAEARVMRAYIYFLLTTLWDNPPFIDHVIADGLPYNSNLDPENPMSHEDLLRWVASECETSVPDLDERKSVADKDGAVKVTKGFANALAGKAYVFLGDWDNAKTALKKVIDSGKYALVSGDRYWENFHIEGDGNEEKIFESNLEFNSGIGVWGGINQRSGWMDANLWAPRKDHFAAFPLTSYMGGTDGWGGLGVPQKFGDDFFANDGHSARFDATLVHIDDIILNSDYDVTVFECSKYAKYGTLVLDDDGKPKLAKHKHLDGTEYEEKQYTFKVSALSDEDKLDADCIGIADVKDGLYGQSFWIPFKTLVKGTDCHKDYGDNVRLNNGLVMRYAEVLLLYAEACINSGDAGQALWAVKEIQERAGSNTISTSVNMETIKKEKSYELWMEGSRFLDCVRWGDTAGMKNAGQDVPKLFDKVHRAPKAGENPVWENGVESKSRFYTVSSHEAIDAKYTVGFVEGKHNHFPFPMTVIEKNPNLTQNPGWE